MIVAINSFQMAMPNGNEKADRDQFGGECGIAMPLTVSEQEQLHACSSIHKDVVMAAALVGCFYCEEIYSPMEIVEWVDKGKTALCPRCGIDSVVPSTCSTEFGKRLLSDMRQYWF